jgi:hypothetical protein
MRRRLFIAALILGILVLALGGWTVRGLRRSGGRRPKGSSTPPVFAPRTPALA